VRWEGLSAVTFTRDTEHAQPHVDIRSQSSQAQASSAQVAGEAVLENVVHAEPAATIDEEVAQQAMNMQWVEDVQNHIGAAGSLHKKDEEKHGEDLAAQKTNQEEVHLLRFGCNDTVSFRKLLLEGCHMRKCRVALETAGCSCELPGGALMFVKPDQCLDVRKALERMELYAYHVIITTAFESDLQDALSSLSYRKRPREKIKHRLEISIGQPSQEFNGKEPEAEESSGGESEGDQISYELCCERTFLCFAPRLKEPDAVVQSTTEAASRAINPRRFA